MFYVFYKGVVEYCIVSTTIPGTEIMYSNNTKMRLSSERYARAHYIIIYPTFDIILCITNIYNDNDVHGFNV